MYYIHITYPATRSPQKICGPVSTKEEGYERLMKAGWKQRLKGVFYKQIPGSSHFMIAQVLPFDRIP